MENILSILKDSQVKPYFFGLGFIQCKISDSERYHFYHPSLQPIVNYEEELHDHRYDFVSTIIKGSLTNKIYNFQLDTNGLYKKSIETCNQNNKITIPDTIDVIGNVQLFLEKTYTKNEKYFMDNNTFHTVNAQYCITHLKRTEYKKEYANVLRPINIDKICPFSKIVDEEKCWDIIKEMLEINP